MKITILTIILGFFVTNLYGQTSFSIIEMKINTIENNNSTEIIYSNSSISINFAINRKVTEMKPQNFVKIDDQIIQFSLLKINDDKKNFNNVNLNDQKQLLIDYSDYEIKYFKSELKIKILNPNNQWVLSKLREWFIWYFRIGDLNDKVEKPTEIQLFSTTIIENKILVINAPILKNGDFKKASYIVNELMESLNNNKK
ncbi:MAG: hypothetical protein HW421_2347 [Ignavibacteria bacterium]|nr:hypothetical protein [Ignavibacteria bacterium]